jgi:hypothetical protein
VVAAAVVAAAAAVAAAARVQAAVVAAVVVEREMGGPWPARAGASCQRVEQSSNHRSNPPLLWNIRVLFLWYSCKEDAPPRGVLF